ncbi:MAG: cytosine permease [Sedimentisphaerales bacterium]|jgi:cytosine permease|nr:cytosine permease [Sedimentisphaerales bacterium]
METTIPNYLRSARPNPPDKRAPWYKNTAPSYAGIFLSVAFMGGMAGAIAYGNMWAGFVGLLVGSLFCFLLYYVPGILGQQTGMPLYVVGASTFGTHGGILLPGLVMGVLQIGWHAVMTFAGASFLAQALGLPSSGATFWVICLVWGLSLAFVGAVGVQLLGRLSSILPIFPLIMVALAAIANAKGLGGFKAAIGKQEVTGLGISLAGIGAFAALQAVAGFFATAGAAGADFGCNSRDQRDVVLGGLFGVTIAPIVIGLLAMLAMAGAVGLNPSIAANVGKQTFFVESIMGIGGALAKVAAWGFVLASICPTGFCALLFANAFSTMFPRLPRMPLALVAGLIGSIGAATGVANNLVIFFLIIGASFGPVIGAMTAQYIRDGGWKGPRKGVNWAGYLAWAAGLLVGMLDMFPSLADQFGMPGLRTIGFSYGLSTLMSYLTGFAVYLILAGLGLEGEVVALPAK